MPMIKNSTFCISVSNGKSSLKKFSDKSKKQIQKPSDETINNILNFAKAYESIESKKFHRIEIIKN